MRVQVRDPYFDLNRFGNRNLKPGLHADVMGSAWGKGARTRLDANLSNATQAEAYDFRNARYCFSAKQLCDGTPPNITPRGHVAKVAGVLALSATCMHVAAAKDELLAPDRACAALRHDVILGAEEQVGYQWPADAIVPCLWVGRECFAPDLTNASSVACVVQVQLLELSFAIDARDALHVHLQLLGAPTAIKLAIAAENPRDWRESTDIGLLVLCLCVLDEGGVVCLTQPCVHAVMISNARLGLGEEGAPAIGRALEADALHSWAGKAGSCVYWRAALQQGQCCDGLHCSQVSVGPTGTA